MELNYIFKFDFNILFSSKIENGILKCSPSICDLARCRVTKRDSLLFNQINQIKDDENSLEEILVIMDFSNFINTHKMTELEEIKGIELIVYKIVDDIDTTECKIVVKDFLKSNSMSKDCQIYYINSEINGADGKNLYNTLMDRVFFGFQEN